MKHRRGSSDLVRNVLAAWLVLVAIGLAVSGLLALNDAKVTAGRAALPPTHWSHRSPAGARPAEEEPDPPRASLPAGFLDDSAPADLGDVVSRATE
jgi:hypothetical protein